MELLNRVVKPNLISRLKQVTLLVEVSNKSSCYNYELLNIASKCGYSDVAHFLLDRNFKASKPSEYNNSVDTPLHNAVKWNDLSLVERLLENEASVLSVDVENNTPLHLAFLLEHTEIVDVILKHLMANLIFANTKNIHGLTQLHIAAARGNALAVQKFLIAGANIKDVVTGLSLYENYSALQFACNIKSLETIKVIVKARPLLEFHNDKYSKNTLEIRSFQESIKSAIIRLYTETLASDQPPGPDCLADFHLACLTLPVEIVKEFLDTGSFVNFHAGMNMRYCSLYTALHFAIEGNVFAYEKVKLLLKYGANVELQNSYCMTPVHLAFYYSDFRSIRNTVRLLYNALNNKEVNLMDINGLTYFHIAVAMNDFKTVESFLNRKVDVNQLVLPNCRNFSYYTPLHFAVKYRHLEMAKLLIKRGANVNTAWGMTPLQLACEAGHTGLMELLIKEGAATNIVCPRNGKTLLHLFIDNIVDCNENLYYFRRKNFRNHLSRPEDVRYWIKRLADFVDVNTKDHEGDTVLHIICSKLFSRSRYAKDLLWYSADINIENNDRKTPFDLACSNRLRPSYDELLVLYHHVQKMKTLGLEINPKNESCCELLMEKKHEWYVLSKKFDEQELERNKLLIMQEIVKLKTTKLDENISLFDCLMMDFQQLTYHALKVKKLIDTVDLTSEFPLYGYLPFLQYRLCLKWLENQSNERKRAGENLLKLAVKANAIKRLKNH